MRAPPLPADDPVPRAAGLQLATRNTDAFSLVPDLKVTSWPAGRGLAPQRYVDASRVNDYTAVIAIYPGAAMAVLTIRNIDDALKTGLRVQAARHGWSMEEEARRILAQALQGAHAELPLGSRLRQHFAGVGELGIPARRPVRAAPVFAAPRGKVR